MTAGPKAIGVLAPQLSGAYFDMLLAGIHAVTRRHGPRLIAIQAAPHEVVHSRLAMDQVDGWIVINNPDGAELLEGSGVPIVTIGGQAPGIDLPALFPDNLAGMRAAVSHLIDHGHARIAFVGDLSNNDIKQRYAGYQAALTERGLTLDPSLVFSAAGSHEETGASAIRQHGGRAAAGADRWQRGPARRDLRRHRADPTALVRLRQHHPGAARGR